MATDKTDDLLPLEMVKVLLDEYVYLLSVLICENELFANRSLTLTLLLSC
jgi:hypothetical protein